VHVSPNTELITVKFQVHAPSVRNILWWRGGGNCRHCAPLRSL